MKKKKSVPQVHVEKPVVRPYSLRINDLELRACDTMLRPKEPFSTLEIRLYVEAETYQTIAYWEYVQLEYHPENSGWDLRFVNHRPLLKTVDKEDFWTLIRTGQKKLEAL